ncbi:helix-turn-helix transcriptional regulator [Arenimonas sp.]|uniref:helix-turn-helix domain-containing protein n=1 Tax=Arenimonas sp. TaxID=1872635 RepID=UPI0025BB509A|nr:helix-turn-helix transcriptional regulator [Arenimonas sp.]
MSQPRIEHLVQAPDMIGALLAAARKQAGMTQGQIGKQLGITQGRVSQIERRASKVTVAMVLQYANLVGMEFVLRPRRTPESSW